METKINCEWVREHLAGYQDGWLDDAERRQVSKHLEICDECKAELELDRNLVANLSGLPTAPVPAVSWDQVRNQRHRGAFQWGWKLGLAVPALAAVLWVASMVAPMRGTSSPTTTVAGAIDDRAFEHAFMVSSTAEPGGDPNRLILTMGVQ